MNCECVGSHLVYRKTPCRAPLVSAGDGGCIHRHVVVGGHSRGSREPLYELATAASAATGGPSLVAGDRQLPADDRRLLVEDADSALHRDRPEAADAGVVRVVQEP